MKKLLLIIFIVLTLTPILKSNPLPVYTVAYISELMFESENNWVIECDFFDLLVDKVDSIKVFSSSGSAKLKEIDNFPYHGSCIITIRKDSLLSDLNIRQAGDSITISFFCNDYIINDCVPLVYGDFVTAQVSSCEEGESIMAIPIDGNSFGAYHYYGYNITKFPSIGEVNTLENVGGTIFGKVYDLDNILKISTYFYYPNLNFIVEKDGSYSAQIHPYKNKIDLLYYYDLDYHDEDPNYYGRTKIKPLDFIIETGEKINIDIYLGYNPADIPSIELEEKNSLKIYPNPITDKILNYQTELPVKSTSTTIEILDMSGKKLAEYPIMENDGSIELPSTIGKGVYLANLLLNGKLAGTSKIVIAE